MLCKRVIARLDIKGNKLIKGIRFEGVRVIGDPNKAARHYEKEGADELLYIDAVASLYGRNSISSILKIASNEIFIPITASGGIRSVSDAKDLIMAGADKIAINTEGIKNPSLIKDLVATFGSQCVVISIQARKKNDGINWEAMTEMGREKSGKDVLEWIKEVQDIGAGEILLTSVDQDGTLTHPDFELIKRASSITRIPLIISGGLTATPDIKSVLENDLVSGVALGGSLHYKKQSISLLKDKLSNKELNLRKNNPKNLPLLQKKPLKNIKVGIINYNMGNQQSLINTLHYLGADVFVSKDHKELDKSDMLILPGVGAFPIGMSNLKKYNLDFFIKTKVQEGVPLIGICLGMQMLFKNSSEFKLTSGLNLINGNVRIMKNDKIKLPHMGWNKIIATKNNFYSLNNLYQYFVHSYVAFNVNNEEVIYKSTYSDETFIAGVKKNNIIGLQFHPERSGPLGMELLTKIIIDQCEGFNPQNNY